LGQGKPVTEAEIRRGVNSRRGGQSLGGKGILNRKAQMVIKKKRGRFLNIRRGDKKTKKGGEGEK